MPETPDIFVSYASRDRDRVLPIVERLEAAGVKVWIDRDGISGGANYALEIAEAIEQARAMLLMCSAASLSSRNVKQEIALGWRFEKPYLPLLLEPVEIPKGVAYWLEAAQWVEVLEQPESVWFPKLSVALNRLGIVAESSKAAPVRTRPLMVGREREQTILRGQLTSMLAGQGSLVLIGGEAGIGKTTLVEDLTIDAKELGCLVLWGHAYDLSNTRPYGPWLEMAAAYPSDAGLPPLPSFVGNPMEVAALGSADRLIEENVVFYLAVARARPTLLILDDLHWFDEESLDLLRALARLLATNRMLILCTFRSDEIHRHHHLFAFLPLLVREAHALRVDVARLDDEARRALIAARYALPVDDTNRLAAYLTSRSEGNPLYAEELLNALEQDGFLTRTDGEWNLGEITDVHVPALLRQVIETRLKHLEPETYTLLQVGAVIGQDVPIDLWQAVTGASDEMLITALEQGREARVLDEGPGATSWGFRHALIREALYEELVSIRRRVLHRQIATEIAATRQPDPDAVAYHYQAANDARAAEWLIRAGERAGRNFAWNTGAERLAAALAWLEHDPEQDQLRGWLLRELAGMLQFSRRGEGRLFVEEALSIGERLGDRALTVSAMTRLGGFRAFSDDIAGGLAQLKAALDLEEHLTNDEWLEIYRHQWSLLDPPPHPLDLSDSSSRELASLTGGALSSYLFFCAAITSRQEEVARLGDEFLRRLDAAGGDERLLAYTSWLGGGWVLALQGLALAYGPLGRVAEADAFFARSDALLRRIGFFPNAMHGTTSWIWYVALAFQTDDLQKRTRLAELQAEYMERAAGSWSEESVVREAYAYPLVLMVLEGRWADARRIAERGSFGVGEAIPIAMSCGYALAMIAQRQGDDATLQRLIDRYLPKLIELGAGNVIPTNPPRLLLTTNVIHRCLDRGDLAQAAAWLSLCGEWFSTAHWVFGYAEHQLLWARYYHLAGDPSHARSFATEALARASDPRQPLVLIAAHRFHGELETIDRRFDAAEDHLRESLALAEACAAPFERALTLLEIARLCMAQGQNADAIDLLAEVRVICEPLDAKPTLARLAVLERTLESAGQEQHHV
jgi:tetratricopeptide (TPR) repeat protein